MYRSPMTGGTGIDLSGSAPPHFTPRKKSHARLITVLIVGGVGVSLIIAVLLRLFVFQTFYTPSGSMEPTIQIGDRIVVNKLAYDFGAIHRGDIVVFTRPPAESCGGTRVGDLVKRVVGLPGETISLSHGDVYIDGKRLNEQWLPLSERDTSSAGPPGTLYSLEDAYVIPPHDYFVMGDNRTDSCDSRYWGPVAGHTIVGKVAVLIWPVSRLRFF